MDMDGCQKALQIVHTIALDPEVGAIYRGKVVSIKQFGAFVEIAPGKDGLVHVSKLDKNRVENVEDVVSVGDEIIVKVMEIKDGKISLSRKDALIELEQRKAENK
jgi:polyribonucleotide nucleotidyltransferase